MAKVQRKSGKGKTEAIILRAEQQAAFGTDATWSKDEQQFTCNLCGDSCKSFENMEAHLLECKEKKKFEEFERLGELAGAAEPAVHRTSAYSDLMYTIELLGMMVEKNCPPDSVTARLFKAAWTGIDNYDPPVELLAKVYNYFHSLPEDERRRILNGWKPEKNRPTQEECLDFYRKIGEDTVSRVLTIGFGLKVDKPLTGSYGFIPEEMLPGYIDLIIAEGTTQAQALATVDAMRKTIAENWQGLMDGRERGYEPLEPSDPAERALSEVQAAKVLGWKEEKPKIVHRASLGYTELGKRLLKIHDQLAGCAGALMVIESELDQSDSQMGSLKGWVADLWSITGNLWGWIGQEREIPDAA